MSDELVPDSLNVIWPLKFFDSSSATGALLTGILYNTASFVCQYRREGDASWTTVTLATMTVGTWVTGGFKETSVSGHYDFGIPNAAIFGGLARWVEFQFSGATNLLECSVKIYLNYEVLVKARGTLVSANTLDSNAVAVNFWYNTDYIYITGGTGKGQTKLINGYTSGRVFTVLDSWAITPDNTSTYIIFSGTTTNVTYWNGIAAAGFGTPIVQIGFWGSSQAATASAATSTTVTFGVSSLPTVDNYFIDNLIHVKSGTGIGQTRPVLSYAGSTKTVTVSVPFATTLDNTSQCCFIPAGATNLAAIKGTAAVGDPGYVGLDFAHATGTTATVSLPNYTLGTVTTITNTIDANLKKILGTTITETTSGWAAGSFTKFFNIQTPRLDVSGDIWGRILGNGTTSIVGPATWSYDAAGAALMTAAQGTTLLNAVNSITTNTARSSPNIPAWFIRPATGTTQVLIKLRLYTLQGVPEDADSMSVTIHATNASGTNYDSRLADTAMVRVSGGEYTALYNVSSTNAAEELVFNFAWAVGAIPMKDGGAATVADADSISTINTINTNLDSLIATVGVAGLGLSNLGDTRLAYLDATVSSRMATFSLPAHFSATLIDASGYVQDVRSSTINTNLNSLITTVGGIETNVVTLNTNVDGLVSTVGVAGVGLTNLGDARLNTIVTNTATLLVNVAGVPAAVVTGMLNILLSGVTLAGSWMKYVSDNVGGGHGPGPDEVTITVTDVLTTLPIAGALVRLASTTAYFQTTDSTGTVIFDVDPATYVVSITASGYVFDGASLVVSGTTTADYTMSTPTNPYPGQCTGTLTCYDQSGQVESGVIIYLELVNMASGSTGTSGNTTARTATSNSFGVVSFSGLWSGATYRARRGTAGDWVDVPVPTSSPFFLPSVLGVV